MRDRSLMAVRWMNVNASPSRIPHSSINTPLARSMIFRDSNCSTERIDLAGEVLHLAKSPDGNFDGRNEIALLVRLHEVRQGPGVACFLDHLALAERRQHQNATDPFGCDHPRRLETIDPGHLDVEDRQVGPQVTDERDGIVAATGLADDVVTLFLEGLAQVETDDGLILGDDNTNRHWRQSLRFGVGRIGPTIDRCSE